MTPIRKQFAAEPAFPFAFVYKDTKNIQSELPDHLHDWYELVYVYRGQGTFFIDQTFYDMQQGDLFAIPGNTIHRALPDKDDPVTSSAVFFSPLLVRHAALGDSFSYLSCFEQAKKRKQYKFALEYSQQSAIEAGLEQIQLEMAAKHLGYRQAVVLHLQQMLLYLNRTVEPGGRHRIADSPFGPLWIREILPYIDEHLHESIGLAELSRRAAVTPAHFSRSFKQFTGMNLTAYVTTKRMIRAKEHLAVSDHTIGRIAELCGFETLPHFHRMFKRIMGLTPAAYRKSLESGRSH